MDTYTGEIAAHALTPSEPDDRTQLRAPVQPPIAAIHADEGYDSFDSHSAILARGAQPSFGGLIPRTKS